MTQVNNPQYFLNQTTEQGFQDDVMIRRKTIAEDTDLNSILSILQQETATQALNMLTSDFDENRGRFKGTERREYIGGQQVATNTKKMVEEQLGTYLGASEDDWWFHSKGTEDHVAEIFGEPGPNGYNVIFDEALMMRLQHSSEYLDEQAKKRKENFSMQNSNRVYTQVKIETAISELERIYFTGEEYLIYSAIVEQIRTSYEEISEGDIEISRIQSLMLLVKKFHFFAVQYHYLSFQETTEEQDEIFQMGLHYFFKKTKSEFNPDLKVIDPLDELGIPDFGFVPLGSEHRRDN